MSDIPDNPANDPTPLLQNASPPVTPVASEHVPTESSTNQPTEMEVHHHGHHHAKKTWKEYLFDFLMLFLAVFLGFLAENLREKGVEKNMEKEYMESLVVDLKNDATLITNTSKQIFDQAKILDDLQQLFSTGLAGGSEELKASYQLSPFLAIIYPLNFNQRTITQLLSSGSMRLIKKEGVADSILAYYNDIKFVEEQIGLYKHYMGRCAESMFNVFDIDYLKSDLYSGEDSIRITPATIDAKKLPTPPAVEVKKLKASMELAKASAFNFGLLLSNSALKKAIQLAKFLEEAYDIKYKATSHGEDTTMKESTGKSPKTDSL